ncbi:YwbE family protein [Bacillus sp. 1P06AnD]|uniref:YwbE family protein n=1 Tax=Bacillus sp. 1P06AnD TaxID=3132208 RepID=UPI0039A30EB6
MEHKTRSNLSPGMEVEIVLKKDQRTGKLTRGTIKRLLTNSATHPHGIKVELTDGQVGRVQHIIKED